jgi:two-component SAPR family response regulator
MNYKNNIGPIIRDGIHFGIAVRSTGNQIPLILSSGTMQNLEEFLGRYNMSREDGNRLFCAYLPKPFLKDDLRRAIDKAEYSLRTTPQPQ